MKTTKSSPIKPQDHYNEVLRINVRTIINDNGEPLFCLRDVCNALSIENSRNVKNRLENGGVFIMDVANSKTNQTGFRFEQTEEMIFIDEMNLYRVIFQSRKEEAVEFQNWVCGEVLPSIRKTGRYEIAQNRPTEEELRIRSEEAKNKAMEEKRKGAELLLKIASTRTLATHKQILEAHAVQMMTGDFQGMLPIVDKTYSASDLAKIYNVSANKIGRIAKANNLKREEFGRLVANISPYNNNREVETFRYNENAKKWFDNFFNYLF